MKKELKTWNLLCKKLKHLHDNNYTARKIFDSLKRLK
jgi:hypothetical protein